MNNDDVDFTKIEPYVAWSMPVILDQEERDALEAHIERLIASALSPEEIEELRIEDE